MVLPLAFIFGVTIGVITARKRGGNKLDKLHYGMAFGIVFILIALTVSILLQRIGVL
tara:strand:- start:1044 stop:1214 length:171 start_codon:yes stop_codon:yes gene_type:complete